MQSILKRSLKLYYYIYSMVFKNLYSVQNAPSISTLLVLIISTHFAKNQNNKNKNKNKNKNNKKNTF